MKVKARKGKLVLHLKEGALHKSLHVKAHEKIPASKEAIHAGDSPLLKKRKQFAINAAGWAKK